MSEILRGKEGRLLSSGSTQQSLSGCTVSASRAHHPGLHVVPALKELVVNGEITKDPRPQAATARNPEFQKKEC